MTLKGQSQGHSDFEWYEICIVYIYLPVAYYHLHLDVTEGSLLAGGVFCCPSGLSCYDSNFAFPILVDVHTFIQMLQQQCRMSLR